MYGLVVCWWLGGRRHVWIYYATAPVGGQPTEVSPNICLTKADAQEEAEEEAEAAHRSQPGRPPGTSPVRGTMRGRRVSEAFRERVVAQVVDRAFTPEEVAGASGLSVATVRNWVRPAVRTS